jgi:hypothetical protein
MGNPAGVKRDFVALEKRRFEAVRLLEKSALNQSEVARRVHVCRQTVSRWAEGRRPGGTEEGRAGQKTGTDGGGSETPRGIAARRPGEAGLGNPALDLRAGGASDRQASSASSIYTARLCFKASSSSLSSTGTVTTRMGSACSSCQKRNALPRSKP